MSESLPSNPFPGPRPYDEKEAARFFGRDEDERKLENLIVNHRVVVLHGPTGCGKSSLMRAKVNPYLAKHEELRTFRADFWPLEKHPLDSLVDGMFHEKEVWKPLLEALRRSNAQTPSLRYQAAIEQLAMMSSDGILLYVDQFEELLRHDRSDTQRSKAENQLDVLVEALLLSVRRTDVSVKLVIGLRDDYLSLFRHRLRDYPMLLAEAYRLERLTRAKILDAACSAAEQGIPPQKDWGTPEVRGDIEKAIAAVQCDPKEESPTAEVEAPFAQIVLRLIFEERGLGEARLLKEGWSARAPNLVHMYLEDTIKTMSKNLAEEKNKPASLFDQEARALLESLVDVQGNRSIVQLDLEAMPERRPIAEALKRAAILRSESRENKEYFQIAHDLLAQKVKTWEEERVKKEAEKEAAEKAAAEKAAAEKAAAEKAAAEKEARAKKEAEKEARRSRRGALLIVLVSVVVAALSASVSVSMVKANQQAESAQAVQSAAAAKEQQAAREAKAEATNAKNRYKTKALLTNSGILLTEKKFSEAALLLREVDATTVDPSDRILQQDVMIRAMKNAPLATLQGHKTYVLWAEWSPDGNFIATADKSGAVALWDPEGKGDPHFAPKPLAGELAGELATLAFEPTSKNTTSKKLLGCSVNGDVIVWTIDTESRELRKEFSKIVKAPVKACAFDEAQGRTAGETRISVFSEDGTLWTVDGSKKEPYERIRVLGKLEHASFSRYAQNAAIVTTDGKVYVLNLEGAVTPPTPIALDKSVIATAAEISPDGKMLLVSGRAAKDINDTAALLFAYQEATTQTGTRVGTAKPDATWQKMVSELPWPVMSPGWTSDGKSYAYIDDGDVKFATIVKQPSPRPAFSKSGSEPMDPWTVEEDIVYGDFRKTRRIRIEPKQGGSFVIALGNQQAALLRFNRPSPSERPTPWKDHGILEWRVRISADGQRALFVEQKDKKFSPKILDLQTWKEISSLPKFERPPISMQFLRDTAFLQITQIENGSRKYSVYDIRQSEARLSWPLDAYKGDPIMGLSANAQTNQLAFIANNAVSLCSTDGKCAPWPSKDKYERLTFSPDGQTLALRDDSGVLTLWDVEKKEQIGQPYEPGFRNSIMYLHERWFLVGNSSADLSKLWPLEQGRPKAGAEPTSLRVRTYNAVFDKEGKWLAIQIQSSDTRIWLWDTRKLDEPRIYEHPVRIAGMHFVDEKDELVLVDYDGNADTISVDKDTGIEPLLAKLKEIKDCLEPKTRQTYLEESPATASEKYEKCERESERKPKDKNVLQDETSAETQDSAHRSERRQAKDSPPGSDIDSTGKQQ